ncbi:AraC-like DNA-binding protein [Prauserella shujinwangii]|uniref:AraC-like DNA-binding protein n=1 Tax=Prauserella shujinwangii TaxID=1453103 RepID=A0A2T0LT84_9PSEU|nr:AraC family transcriptional regulator [Prauserella shujinwangii]PRX46904.1 AraC-like DNA-binding protein [Prauserella shujinwangii]
MLAQIHSVSAVASGCLQVVPGTVAEPLRPYVAGYSGFRATPEGALLRRILPFNVATLIVDWTGAPPLVTGPRATGLRYQGPGWRDGISVGVTPAGVRALLGVRQNELADRIVPLDDVLGPWAGRLARRLAEVPDWAGRFAVLDRWFAARLASAGEADPEPVITRAWWRLQTGPAPVTIGALAAEFGVSRRYLQLGFRRQVGLTPKTVARIARFQRAAVAMAGPRATAAGPGHGFADQSHFCRETRALAGVTPRELFAFLQDAHPRRA